MEARRPFFLCRILVLLFVHGFGFFEQLLHFFGKLFLLIHHPAVAHGFLLGSVCLDLGPVKRHVAKLDQTRLFAYPQHLDEQAGNGGKMPLAEVRNPAVIRMTVTTQDSKSHVFIRLVLYLTRSPNSNAVP